MKKVIKVSEHKRWEIELIRLEKKGPTLLNVRQFYCTKKDPEWKPGRQGMTLSLEGEKPESSRMIKAMIAVLKSEGEEKPRLIKKEG